MSTEPARDQSPEQQTSLDLATFASPLALLDYILREKNLPLTAVSIAEICDYYLALIDFREEQTGMVLASEFIIVAAQLLQLKSRLLLPQSQSEEIVTEAGDPLIFQILSYRRNRLLAEDLILRHQIYPYLNRPLSPSAAQLGITAGPEQWQLSRVSLEAAISRLALQQTERFQDPQATITEIIKLEPYSVQKKLKELRQALKKKAKLSFPELLHERYSIGEQIAAFLAILELLRLDEIDAEQSQAFATIVIRRREEAK